MFYCSAVCWIRGWDRTGGSWEREWEGGGIRSPRLALLLLLLFVLIGPVEIGWSMHVRPVHTIEDTTVTNKQYTVIVLVWMLCQSASVRCFSHLNLPAHYLYMPLIQGCLLSLTNSTTGHYNSTCIHSTSLWLVFLAKKTPLEHTFIVLNKTSTHCYAYWNIQKAYILDTKQWS